MFWKNNRKTRADINLSDSNSIFYNLEFNGNSNIPLDILIPTCTKDIKKLKEVVDSIRNNVAHPIIYIYIIAPKGICEQFCSANNCVFVNEDDVLPITVQDIQYIPKGIDRSGWIFQQLIKLNADNISNNEYILIVDSDTIFSQPQTFIQNNKMVLNCSDEYHLPYSMPLKVLTDLNNRFEFSFVAHHMLFKSSYLKEIKEKIETKTNQKWHEAIINSLDPNETSSFSEYELYGNYVYFNHRESIVLRYWYNLSLSRKRYKDINAQKRKLYKTISLHSYNEKKKHI